MHINVTFCMQIINFWITYIFLKRLLLKPLMGVLNRRAYARQHLSEVLKEKEFLLKQKVEEKNKALIDFQVYLKQQYHNAPAECPEIPGEVIYKRNKAEIDTLISLSKDLLVKKVPHAY